jgi:hypothetical protein
MFGYMNDNSFYGPFETEELAIEDAKNQEFEEITIGEAEFVKPIDYLTIDLDGIMRDMEEAASDDIDASEIFTLKPNAEKALLDALVPWIENYIETDCWILKNERNIEVK